MIHGGAFVMGSPDDYGPDFLFDQADFVMVPNTVQVHILFTITIIFVGKHEL